MFINELVIHFYACRNDKFLKFVNFAKYTKKFAKYKICDNVHNSTFVLFPFITMDSMI